MQAEDAARAESRARAVIASGTGVSRASRRRGAGPVESTSRSRRA